MSYKKWLKLFWLATSFLLLATGCSQTNESQATEGSVQFTVSVPQALTGDNITRVTVTVSANDMASKTIVLTKSNGAWSGTLYGIPAGAGRTFTAEAFDADYNLRFRGQVTDITITAGSTQVVAITLQSIDPSTEFDNSAPCIDALIASASSVRPGGTIDLRATVHDPDVTDTLTSAWSATSGSFSSTTSLLTTWTAPSSPGIVTLTLVVTDSRGATATVRLDINVININDSASGSAAVNISFNNSPAVQRIVISQSPVSVGATTEVTVTAADAEQDTLSYTWSASCAGTWTDATARIARFTPSAVPVGSTCANCALTVNVMDSQGGRNIGTLRICVSNSSTTAFPPRFLNTSQSATSVLSGGSVRLRVAAEDGDGSALSFAWTASSGSTGSALNTLSTSEISWTAPACAPSGGAPSITATVTNARGYSVSHTFYISVTNGASCTGGGGSGSDGGTGGSDGGTGGSGGGGNAPSETWTPTGSLLTGRYMHVATPLPSGKVMVTGGLGESGTTLPSAEIFDPALGSWSFARQMASARNGHAVTVLPSGKVLVTGGYNSSMNAGLKTVEIYDPATNSWSLAAPMTFTRYNHTATLLPSGKVLVVGGTTSSGGATVPELYDPAMNTWRPVASMASARSSHQALLLPSGKVLVTGGGGNPITEMYDPSIDLWTTASGLTNGWNHALPLASGKILFTASQEVKLYDPVLYTLTPAGNFIQGRSYYAVAQVASGKVLVTGGFSSTSTLTELYDPATGVSTYTASMPEPRYYHTATRLPSGQVLVVGGYWGGVLTSASIYTP